MTCYLWCGSTVAQPDWLDGKTDTVEFTLAYIRALLTFQWRRSVVKSEVVSVTQVNYQSATKRVYVRAEQTLSVLATGVLSC